MAHYYLININKIKEDIYLFIHLFFIYSYFYLFIHLLIYLFI